MNKIYLSHNDLASVEILRKIMVNNIDNQEMDMAIKIDMKLKFGKWIGEWTTESYWSGVSIPGEINPQI
jgi:hypothetical protein